MWRSSSLGIMNRLYSVKFKSQLHSFITASHDRHIEVNSVIESVPWSPAIVLGFGSAQSKTAQTSFYLLGQEQHMNCDRCLLRGGSFNRVLDGNRETVGQY